jgi:hypothetical protein
VRRALGIREPKRSQTAKDQARLHGENARIYFAQSQAAYKTRDGFEAKELSRLGKLELERRKVKEAQAHEEIFTGASKIICCSCRMMMMPLMHLDPSQILAPQRTTPAETMMRSTSMVFWCPRASDAAPIHLFARELILHRCTAIRRTNIAIRHAERDKVPKLRIIVGKGIHTEGGKAKIKPAVLAALRK